MFPVHLENQIYLGGRQFAGIVHGPRRAKDRSGRAGSRPKFLRQVRRKRGEQLQERVRCFATDRRRFLLRVGENHHLRNGRVEAEILDIFAHLLDRFMQ